MEQARKQFYHKMHKWPHCWQHSFYSLKILKDVFNVFNCFPIHYSCLTSKYFVFDRCSYCWDCSLKFKRKSGCLSITVHLHWDAGCAQSWVLCQWLENTCLDLHGSWMHPLYHDFLHAWNSILAGWEEYDTWSKVHTFHVKATKLCKMFHHQFLI